MVLAWMGVLLAQTGTSPNDAVIRINVNLVQIDAVVTDKQGRPVTDLQAAEFEVLQDGRTQGITNFSYIAVRRERRALRLLCSEPGRRGRRHRRPRCSSPARSAARWHSW